MDESAGVLAAARWPLAVGREADWLRELTCDDGLTGFMPPALPDAAWVLHSMYEHQVGPTGWSFVEYRRRAGAPCLAYYSPLLHGAEGFDNLHIRTGTLADALVLYDHPDEDGWTPSNLWPRDRSWVLCTDYDLWVTKVAGPPALIEALLDDAELEAVRLPWAT
ncbi:hypothetical protein [Streptomyces sp. NPDC050145]|uniref:hypothetical protein n=1 Tax=Streptomyces sp. NPDC050145 TaxID=3365602 RepID=UPI0037A10016